MAPPRRVLRQQLEILIDFIEENKELLQGTGGTSMTHQYTRSKWAVVAKRLNAVKSGALKAPDRWKKYWFEWRHRCRKRAADARRLEPGSNKLVPLNDLEIRLIQLSGQGNVIAAEPKPMLHVSEDSDSQPLENIKSQAVPVKKIKLRRSVTSTSRAASNHDMSDGELPSAPPKWAIEMEERRIAAEERMAAALESIASVMQAQEERRAMLDERLADAVTTMAGSMQDLNNGLQETLQRLHHANLVQTNGPDFKGNFML